MQKLLLFQTQRLLISALNILHQKKKSTYVKYATIGAFTIMKHLNKLLQTAYTIETNSGLLAITANGEQLFMEQTVPTFYDTLTLEELSGCFDLNAVATAFPIQIVSTPKRYFGSH